MLNVLVILLATATAGAVIAGAAFYFWQEKVRTRQAQKECFRDALLLQLRKKGPSSLDFNRLVAENDVPAEVAHQVAATLYARYFAKALSDAKVTEAERRQLDSLRHALALPAEVTSDIEKRATAERYHCAALSALADGKITAEEEAELDRLRNRLGLSAQQALQVVGTPAWDSYLALFRQVIHDGRMTPEEVEELRRHRKALGISRGDANDVVRGEVVGLYRQWFYNVIQDGQVTPEEEQALAWLRQEFGLESVDTDVYESQLQEVKELAACRQGDLPALRTGKLLEGGEICHWEDRCRFEWKTATQAKVAEGDLVVTSQRLVFTSPIRSFSFSPSKIMDIKLYSDALVVQSASNRGNGTYYIRQPRQLEAILVGLARRHKYQLSAKFSSNQSRHIPDSVRREVWRRDGGRCVRCSAVDYLEYDHIIPHGRGGANTVANVQILCRRCNNLKSDRI